MVLVKPEDYSGENVDGLFEKYKLKTPKRTLQFSDGVLEEYSTDEEDNSAEPTQEIVDTAAMTWGPWMLYKTWAAGTSTLSFLDYLGETLASFFGITTPRYYFELEEYKRRQANEAEQADQEKGWTENRHDVIEVPLKNLGNAPSSQSKVEEV